MKIRKKHSEFENAPVGTYPALITVVADLGLQETGYGKRQEMIGLAFELAGPRTKNGSRFAVLVTCTAILHGMSRLLPVVRAALGAVPEQELNPKALLGKPVLVEVIHRTAGDGRVWANVGTVLRLPEGTEAPKTETALLYFDLESPDPEVYQKLPALFKKRIENRIQKDAMDPDSAPDDVSF